jgi:crotonobetainyl-CoA:carnitine CoA-transferase CaiB-like acyl-CoA transferase
MSHTEPPSPSEAASAASALLPLAGVRVVEFVHMVMGPTCGLVLADLGAEVIKIEPAGAGDNTRRLTGSGAGYWPAYNRNKLSLALDLQSPAAREAVLRLVATADVVTENFRPGAMERLGLDYATLRKVKPDLVYCSMKGFLPGPYAHRTALDEVVQMMGGLAYMTGPVGRPLRAGASVNDVMGGMFAAIGILAALHERAATGRGRHIESGLFENNAFLMAQHMMQYRVTGKPAAPMPARVSAWAIYDVFTVAGGDQVFVGVVTDSQWKAFCGQFGLADLAADATLATNRDRVHARDRVMPVVRALFADMPKAEVMARCEAAGLPFAPIARPEDLFDDPHLNAPGAMTEVTLADGTRTPVPALPIAIDGARLGTRTDVPAVGEHGRAILAELGYDDAAITRILGAADAGAR